MRILFSSPQRPFLVVGSLERGGKKKKENARVVWEKKKRKCAWTDGNFYSVY